MSPPRTSLRLSAPASAGTMHWTLSALVVVAVHAGIIALMFYQRQPPPGPPPPESAIMMELAPAPESPPAPPTEVPPGPEQVEAPPRPAPAPPEPEIETPPEARSEASLPPPAPDPVEPEPDDRPPAEVTTTTPAMVAREAERVATVKASWQGALLGHLDQLKRYPLAARRRRQEGVAWLRFSMDRQGQVLEASLERSSGHGMLDDEVMALIERAQPLPPPPPEVEGDPLELVVPVEFYIR